MPACAARNKNWFVWIAPNSQMFRIHHESKKGNKMKALVKGLVVTLAVSCSSAMPGRSQELIALPAPAALPALEVAEDVLANELDEIQQRLETELTPALEAV